MAVNRAPGQYPGAFAPLDPEAAVKDLFRFIDNPGTRFGTGWSIDEKVGMVGKGEMALCIARSSAGKSSWMLNVIANTPHVPTVVMNMEMTPRTQIQWLTSMSFDLMTPAYDFEEVLRAGPDDDRWAELRDALERMPQAYPNLHFVMPSRPHVDDIAVIVQDIEDQTGVRPVRVFVDHMKYLAGSEKGYEGYTANSMRAKQVAMDEDIAVYLLQQTGRRDGGGEANDGHLPVKFGSGLYGGEEDADWMFGFYRPERDPRFRKSRHQFEDPSDWLKMLDQRDQVRGLFKFQVIKNRIFSELEEDGFDLWYDSHTRRLKETPPR